MPSVLGHPEGIRDDLRPLVLHHGRGECDRGFGSDMLGGGPELVEDHALRDVEVDFGAGLREFRHRLQMC